MDGVQAYELSHKILTAQYFDETILLNRIYLVGVDDDGNLVYGETDSVSGIEHARQIVEPMISTTANANTVSANVITKDRLNYDRGQITTFPHPGLETGDVIKVTDSPCNQSADTFRVKGISYLYNPMANNPGKQTIGLTAV
jgi:hypothetical protein